MILLRNFIETHFGLVLLIACAVGLVAPIENVPDDSASIALALLTYASCFKLRDGGFSDIRWRDIWVFYLLRYIILPVALFALAHVIIPEYALGVFLLALVPAAVSSPAFSTMFSGTVPPAFAIVIVSTLLAPFLIPLQFYWASEVAIHISPFGLFKTLAFCIFLPMACYIATKRFQRWGNMMYDNVKLISIVLVFFVIALVIAKQRGVILADLPGLIIPTIASFTCYLSFFFLALWFARKHSREDLVAYTVCSGFNNVALGVSLALLHFPPKIILLVAVSEMAWATLPSIMKLYLKRF